MATSLDLLRRFPFDPTGESQDNYIQDEEHSLEKWKIIIPHYRPIYVDSLVIVDVVNNRRLDKEDYRIHPFHNELHVKVGKEVAGEIIITNKQVSDRVRIHYQTVGGIYQLSYDMDAVVQKLNIIEKLQKNVTWDRVLAKPDFFPPGYHLHDIGDIYGFEHLIYAIRHVGKQVVEASFASNGLDLSFIEERFKQFQAYIDDLLKKANDAIVKNYTTIKNMVDNNRTYIDTKVKLLSDQDKLNLTLLEYLLFGKLNLSRFDNGKIIDAQGNEIEINKTYLDNIVKNQYGDTYLSKILIPISKRRANAITMLDDGLYTKKHHTEISSWDEGFEPDELEEANILNHSEYTINNAGINETIGILTLSLKDRNGITADKTFIRFEWYLNDKLIEQWDKSYLPLLPEYQGRQIKLLVKFLDAKRFKEIVYVMPEGKVDYVKRTHGDSVLTAGGQDWVGGKATIVNDTTPLPSSSITQKQYKWYKRHPVTNIDTLIEGVQGDSLVLSDSMLGCHVWAVATWTELLTDDVNGPNYKWTKVSNKVGPIGSEKRNLKNTSTLSLSAPSNLVGQTVTSNLSLQDADGVDHSSVVYKWSLQGGGDVSLSDTGSTLVLREDMVGKFVNLNVVFNDGVGHEEQVSSSNVIGPVLKLGLVNVPENTSGLSVNLDLDFKNHVGDVSTMTDTPVLQPGVELVSKVYKWHKKKQDTDYIYLGAGDNYTNTEDDVGYKIRGTVVYTLRSGTSTKEVEIHTADVGPVVAADICTIIPAMNKDNIFIEANYPNYKPTFTRLTHRTVNDSVVYEISRWIETNVRRLKDNWRYTVAPTVPDGTWIPREDVPVPFNEKEKEWGTKWVYVVSDEPKDEDDDTPVYRYPIYEKLYNKAQTFYGNNYEKMNEWEYNNHPDRSPYPEFNGDDNFYQGGVKDTVSEDWDLYTPPYDSRIYHKKHKETGKVDYHTFLTKDKDSNVFGVGWVPIQSYRNYAILKDRLSKCGIDIDWKPLSVTNIRTPVTPPIPPKPNTNTPKHDNPGAYWTSYGNAGTVSSQ